METQKKAKNKKGCLIAIVVVVVLAIIGAIAGGDDKKDTKLNVADNNTETQKVSDIEKRKNDSLIAVRLKELDDLISKQKNNFKSEFDDINEITWYYPKSRPYYANSKAFFSYIGLNKDNSAWKRLIVRYHGNDWLFVNKIIVKTESNTYNLDASNVKRDNNADVWEWIDIPLTSIEEVIVNDIIQSKQAKVRFIGQQYHSDWSLGNKEIEGLKQIQSFYDLLNERQLLLPLK